MRRSASLEGDEFRAVLRPLLLLAVTVFIDLLGFGLVLPNMPQYVEAAVGRNHGHAAAIGGMLGASYSFTQFLFAPLWGRYSDRVGRRPIILLSLAGVGIAYILFGLAHEHLWMLFAARLLAGVLSSASIGVAFAYVADVTSAKNRARGIGLLGACFGLGFMLGPTFGGVLGHFHLSLPAFVAAGIALVNFAFTWKYLPESLPPEARIEHETGARYTPLLVLRVVRGPAGLLFLITFLVIFAFSALEQSFGYYLLSVPEFHLTAKSQPLVNGLILGFVGLAAVIVQGGLIGRLVRRFGEDGIGLTGITLMVIGFAALPLARSLILLAIGPMLILSVGRALYQPALSALISQKANLGQGLTLSTSSSFDSLARTFGPLTAGWLFSTMGASAPYLASAAVLLIVLVIALANRRQLAPVDYSDGRETRDRATRGDGNEEVDPGVADGDNAAAVRLPERGTDR